MNRSEIVVSRDDAEKLVEFLEGVSTVLRSSMPERLVELLKALDQTGVYEPLRYDIPIGPVSVAEEADAVRTRLTSQLGSQAWCCLLAVS